MSGRLLELSHPIRAGMETYPGLPGPAVTDFLSREASAARYAGGATFQIARIDMVANTGTYVDAPFHRFAGRPDVAELPLERLADLVGVVLDVSSRAGRAIGAETLDGLPVEGKAVLVRTDWDRHWGARAYFEGHPFLTRAAAAAFAAARPALVGIDSLNIDDTADGERPAHTLLLGAGIPIVEHLCNLAALPPTGFRLHAVPAPLHGVGSFPARVYAVLPTERR